MCLNLFKLYLKIIQKLVNSTFFQSEFCEVKKKYDEAKERLENDVKDITELMKVRIIIFLRVLLLLDTAFS